MQRISDNQTEKTGGLSLYYSTAYASPIGMMTLACHDNGLAGLWFRGQKYYGGGIPKAMAEKDDIPVFITAKNWLDRYFAGEKPGIDELPLAPAGSAFRLCVWRMLCEIPYGTVTTYAAIAKKAAAHMGRDRLSSQAVGGAVGHNPLSIIIPCHRVVGSNGSLTGYAGGLDIKMKLLELEGVDMRGLFVPK